jgi:hypothetical protein
MVPARGARDEGRSEQVTLHCPRCEASVSCTLGERTGRRVPEVLVRSCRRALLDAEWADLVGPLREALGTRGAS